MATSNLQDPAHIENPVQSPLELAKVGTTSLRLASVKSKNPPAVMSRVFTFEDWFASKDGSLSPNEKMRDNCPTETTGDSNSKQNTEGASESLRSDEFVKITPKSIKKGILTFKQKKINVSKRDDTDNKNDNRDTSPESKGQSSSENIDKPQTKSNALFPDLPEQIYEGEQFQSLERKTNKKVTFAEDVQTNEIPSKVRPISPKKICKPIQRSISTERSAQPIARIRKGRCNLTPINYKIKSPSDNTNVSKQNKSLEQETQVRVSNWSPASILEKVTLKEINSELTHTQSLKNKIFLFQLPKIGCVSPKPTHKTLTPLSLTKSPGNSLINKEDSLFRLHSPRKRIDVVATPSERGLFTSKIVRPGSQLSEARIKTNIKNESPMRHSFYHKI